MVCRVVFGSRRRARPASFFEKSVRPRGAPSFGAMAPAAKAEKTAKGGEAGGSPGKKGRKGLKGSPTKAAALPVEFDWSADLIEECMMRGDSGAHLAKYCGTKEQITGDGSAPVVKKWAAPTNIARRHKSPAKGPGQKGASTFPSGVAERDVATAASLGDLVQE